MKVLALTPSGTKINKGFLDKLKHKRAATSFLFVIVSCKFCKELLHSVPQTADPFLSQCDGALMFIYNKVDGGIMLLAVHRF